MESAHPDAFSENSESEGAPWRSQRLEPSINLFRPLQEPKARGATKSLSTAVDVADINSMVTVDAMNFLLDRRRADDAVSIPTPCLTSRRHAADSRQLDTRSQVLLPFRHKPGTNSEQSLESVARVAELEKRSAVLEAQLSQRRIPATPTSEEKSEAEELRAHIGGRGSRDSCRRPAEAESEKHQRKIETNDRQMAHNFALEHDLSEAD